MVRVQVLLQVQGLEYLTDVEAMERVMVDVEEVMDVDLQLITALLMREILTH